MKVETLRRETFICSDFSTRCCHIYYKPSKDRSREKVARRYRAMHERDAAASASRFLSGTVGDSQFPM